MAKKNIEKSTFAKECMFLALKQLMSEKPFHEITITDITNLAGVSRSTFYRNFSEKEDIIRDYFLTDPLGAGSLDQYDEEHFSLYDRIHDCYQYISDNKTFIINIVDSNLEELLINNFLSIMKGVCAPRADEYGFTGKYGHSALAGLCFMVCYDWVSTGMRETVDEITKISYDIIMKYDNANDSVKPIKK